MEARKTTPRRALKTHFDAVVYFFTKMDADMIFDLLDSDREYQGFQRHVFVRKVGDLFHDLQTMGDTRLIAMVDNDPLPVDGNFGVTFEGNNTNLYLDVIFEVDSIGFITDIYEITDVLDEGYLSPKRQRVFIDQQLDDSGISFEGDDSFPDIDDDMLF